MKCINKTYWHSRKHQTYLASHPFQRVPKVQHGRDGSRGRDWNDVVSFLGRGWFNAWSTVGNTLKSSSTSLDISSGRRLGITMQQSLHGSGTDGGSGGDHVCCCNR